MEVACLDLEGVLVPEIWINVAERTGIDALRATTRDVADYDVLMCQRLELLRRHRLRFSDLRSVIDSLEPLPGAREFLEWLRERFQVIVLSDTYYEFVPVLMAKIDSPTLFCNHLELNGDDSVRGYRLRQRDQKRCAVQALHALNFRVIASGDSYNDLTMLTEADAGILFRPPDQLVLEYPRFPVARTYLELQERFVEVSARDLD